MANALKMKVTRIALSDCQPSDQVIEHCHCGESLRFWSEAYYGHCGRLNWANVIMYKAI